MMTLKEVKAMLRAGPYSWPGGYPIYFVSLDGGPLSFKAVRANWRQVIEAYREGECVDWRMMAADINWEDEQLICAETNEPIECAYPKD